MTNLSGTLPAGSPVERPGFGSAASGHFSPQALRDFELIERILIHKDEKAYTELLDYYRRPVFHLIYRMVRQTEVAEDLTMEVLTRAYRYLARFQPVFAFSTWLFRIATNHCIDFLRRRRLQTVSLQAAIVVADRESSFFELPDAALTPQEMLIQTQRNEHLRRAVAQLPPLYQHIVELHYFEELSYGEIATQLGSSLAAVKSRLHRGRELLAQQLSSTLARV
ncbi:RNA polymerase sigma factor [Hymenobacter monticola]|uniref:Sigma-70 family RNA polymerase sigma factor n=1 Tax=Hymenobacter monticola TaxID=1705399 RepID=A0ABY4BDY5_9BACT|nr:sigma-70 family RNA polymerase sigma factor [Hymenobacter monticola]UOE36512.1 sigma-70 family RNA polymerase sigma factor [Hymenobacter monticola]